MLCYITTGWTGWFYTFGGSVEVEVVFVVVEVVTVVVLATGYYFLTIGNVEVIVLFPFDRAKPYFYWGNILNAKINLAPIVSLHLSFK